MAEKKCANYKGEDKQNSLPEKATQPTPLEILQKRLDNYPSEISNI